MVKFCIASPFYLTARIWLYSHIYLKGRLEYVDLLDWCITIAYKIKSAVTRKSEISRYWVGSTYFLMLYSLNHNPSNHIFSLKYKLYIWKAFKWNIKYFQFLLIYIWSLKTGLSFRFLVSYFWKRHINLENELKFSIIFFFFLGNWYIWTLVWYYNIIAKNSLNLIKIWMMLKK